LRGHLKMQQDREEEQPFNYPQT
jgi:methionine-rich copper-binding protein CopC